MAYLPLPLGVAGDAGVVVTGGGVATGCHSEAAGGAVEGGGGAGEAGEGEEGEEAGACG